MQVLKRLIAKCLFVHEITPTYILRTIMFAVVQQHQEDSDIKLSAVYRGHL